MTVRRGHVAHGGQTPKSGVVTRGPFTDNSTESDDPRLRRGAGAAGADGADGADGDVGPPGRPGRDGASGPPGPAGPPGFGFDGDDGEQGIPGLRGARGEQGAAGPDGPPGYPVGEGERGEDGDDGAPGPRGRDGLDGPAGLNGWPGFEGQDGEDGATLFVGIGKLGNRTFIGAAGSEPVARPGDLYFENNGMMIGRYASSAWARIGPVWPITKPVLGDFSWINQGGATAVQTNGGIYQSAPANAGVNIRLLKKSATSPYTVTAMIRFNWLLHSSNTQLAGLAYRQSSDGKLIAHGIGRTAAGIGIKVSKYTSPTVFSAHYSDGTQLPNLPQFPPALWMRIKDDGANRISSVSFDGFNFIDIHSVGRTDYMTADEVGFFCNDQSAASAVSLMLISWLQE